MEREGPLFSWERLTRGKNSHESKDSKIEPNHGELLELHTEVETKHEELLKNSINPVNHLDKKKKKKKG
jgi:hypothetical protein